MAQVEYDGGYSEAENEMARNEVVVGRDDATVHSAAERALTKTPALSPRETSSAKDWTCIFSITLWRWALMVRSEVPSAMPICLFFSPRMTSSKTCRSRELAETGAHAV